MFDPMKMTIGELFEQVASDGLVGVVPVNIRPKEDDGRGRFLVVVQGDYENAAFLVAEMMRLIEDMHDRAAQLAAAPDKSVIGSKDGSRTRSG